MATVKNVLSTRTALSASGLPTLASGNFTVSGTYTITSGALDLIIEIDAETTNTPTGNKQLLVFVQESLDGTNFRSGPISGTTTTDMPNLRLLGVLPMNSSGATEITTFSIFQALGYCPAAFRIVVYNDLGVALTSGTLWTSEISATVA